GGGPNVRIFDGATGQQLQSFFPFDPNFRGGVNVAAAKVTTLGHAEIIAGAGPGGGPNVKVLDSATLQEVQSFFPFDPNFRGGVSVAAADVTGDGKDDIVVGAGPGGGANVKVFDGSTFEESQSFFAFDPKFRGGVNVA